MKISVEDSGIGMQPSLLEDLRQILSSSENLVIPKTKSTGMFLGLQISQQLAKLLSPGIPELNGIKIESEQKKGSKFTLYVINDPEKYLKNLNLNLKL